ncbi:MAG: hypothetical protein E7379_01935 [Clostridiales bacterium]|nr:hypothetical protein [Clostridiales bacterium]
MTNKLKTLENKINNSKCQVTKNVLYYIIAPAILLLIGIILLCTVGFNGSTQLVGGSTFNIYVNNEGKITDEDAVQYDLDKDFGKICGLISATLADGNIRIEGFQKSQMDIEGLVAGGDAVKVTFFNVSNDKDEIENKNNLLRDRLISEFGYASSPEAVSEIEYFEGSLTMAWALNLVACIIFAATLALIYMALRTRNGAWLLGLLNVVIDLACVGALLLICRVPVSSAICATMVFTGLISMFNVYAFYAKSETSVVNGKYNNLKASEMADETAKIMAFKKIVLYVIALVVVLITTIMPVAGLREVGIGCLLSLIASFYTSNFILPAIWTLSYKPSKKKNNKSKEANN